MHYAHLALSGGGANGAFGAGFLNGWSSAGNRPVFKIVTGVSTGALMAPFAFLGPSYDPSLREFYTTTSSRDIFILGSLFNLARRFLFDEALADTGPLARLIERHVDAELVQRVAEAHDRGRRLYIGTVDLDSLGFVVWNMGLIAKSGRPEALILFRKVMLASASIPIVFPPVFFDVEADGQRFDEMHVDGAVGARVFYNEGLFSPGIIPHPRAPRPRGGTRGYLRDPQRAALSRSRGRREEQSSASPHGCSTPRAAPRSSATCFASILSPAVRTPACIGSPYPDGIQMAGEEVFDPVGMSALFEVGYRSAAAGAHWATAPPGLHAEPGP